MRRAGKALLEGEAVVPANAPHDLYNVGEGMLRVRGFFYLFHRWKRRWQLRWLLARRGAIIDHGGSYLSSLIDLGEVYSTQERGCRVEPPLFGVVRLQSASSLA
jgi:hypothetical protein